MFDGVRDGLGKQTNLLDQMDDCHTDELNICINGFHLTFHQAHQPEEK
jgi:hypothetical protein